MVVIQKPSQPSNNAPGAVFHLACFGETGPTVADSKHRHQPRDVSLGKTMRTHRYGLLQMKDVMQNTSALAAAALHWEGVNSDERGAAAHAARTKICPVEVEVGGKRK